MNYYIERPKGLREARPPARSGFCFLCAPLKYVWFKLYHPCIWM